MLQNAIASKIAPDRVKNKAYRTLTSYSEIHPINNPIITIILGRKLREVKRDPNKAIDLFYNEDQPENIVNLTKYKLTSTQIKRSTQSRADRGVRR